VNDDRLVGLLAALRTERMDRRADRRLRTRLETAWAARESHNALPAWIRRPVLALASSALIFGFTATTLSAPGDSVLYGLRVTLEDLAIPLHADPGDRAEYLLSLLEQRTTEAARLEATGNALAAGRVREIERQTLLMVHKDQPVTPAVVEPAPTESPSASPTPAPTASATPSPTSPPSPTPSSVPTATQRPATPRPTTAATATPKPPTATPKPTTTAVAQLVTFTGTIKNPDGTPATNVCVSTSVGGSCLAVTGPTFSVTVSAKIGQSQTLYFLRTDGIKNYKASITKTVSSTYIDVGTVLLRVQ
jgi:hypothetical protein